MYIIRLEIESLIKLVECSKGKGGGVEKAAFAQVRPFPLISQFNVVRTRQISAIFKKKMSLHS